MLFDNAKLQPSESILVHAGGSGIGTVAIKMAKALGCTVITTVVTTRKPKGQGGRRHVINYRTDRLGAWCASSPREASMSSSNMSAPDISQLAAFIKRGGRR